MKFALMGVLFFSNLAFSSECAKPTKEQTVYICDKLVSSEVKGFPEDKVTTAKYKLWLSADEPALCIDGGLGTLRSKNSIYSNDSTLPQKTQKIFKWQKQELKTNDNSWILSIIGNNTDHHKNYPNYPEGYDKYSLDRKEMILTISQPTGIKSFATFKLSCVKNN